MAAMETGAAEGGGQGHTRKKRGRRWGTIALALWAFAFVFIGERGADAFQILGGVLPQETLLDATVARVKEGAKGEVSASAKAGNKRINPPPQKKASERKMSAQEPAKIPEEEVRAFESLALPDPSDPLDRLYGRKRLAKKGDFPVLSVGIMGGKTQVILVAKSKASLSDDKGRKIDVTPGTKLTFAAQQSQSATKIYVLSAGAFSWGESQNRSEAIQEWTQRGVTPSFLRVGLRFAVRGKMVDTRKDLLVVGRFSNEALATEQKNALEEKFGFRIQIHEVMTSPPQGKILVADNSGKVIFTADTAAFLAPMKSDGLLGVNQVEFAKGYAHHGFQDRTYRGSLAVALDENGTLSVVNVIDLESYLRGIVPSEIFPRSHSEALKAQAVTARGEVLAKLGTRHLSDPFHLCGEQHCQVYSGVLGEAASTDGAVKATEGEFLFDVSGALVDTTYSAVCGGHTEDNDVVWGTQADGNLRGKWDVPGAFLKDSPSPLNLRDEKDLRAFLDSSTRSHAFCATASFASSTKFRWEKRFSQREIDEIGKALGVGHVRAMHFSGRGSSGRASALTIEGDKGARQLRGELNIRRKFQNLNSTMAIIESPKEDGDDWIFRGGGWGHGVGMCQIGAIGRAEAGQSYIEILDHYFGGARVEKVYGVKGKKDASKASGMPPFSRDKH